MRAVLETFLVLFSVLVRSKVTIIVKISFIDYAKLTVNWKIALTSQFPT